MQWGFARPTQGQSGGVPPIGAKGDPRGYEKGGPQGGQGQGDYEQGGQRRPHTAHVTRALDGSGGGSGEDGEG
jgi:hypothetical protein